MVHMQRTKFLLLDMLLAPDFHRSRIDTRAQHVCQALLSTYHDVFCCPARPLAFVQTCMSSLNGNASTTLHLDLDHLGASENLSCNAPCHVSFGNFAPYTQ